MSDLAGKRLLIMHGTHIAAEIVRAAQRLGATAVVADYNPVEKAPAKQIADEHYNVSLLDVDAVVQLIKDKNIDGVAAGFSDLLLPYYAQVCDKAGLPSYGTEEQFKLFTNKTAYLDLFRQYGIPTIPGYSLDIFTEDDDTQVEYPVIVKPASGSGSRGITICHNRDEVLAAAQSANDTFFGNDVVIEKYLDGEEATAFWMFQDGHHYLSAFANRHVTTYSDGGTPIPYAYTMPSSHLPAFERDTHDAMLRMFRELNLQNGMLFVQGKIDGGVFRSYDAGFRLTGTQEYWLLKELSGFNPLDMLIEFALTGTMSSQNIATRARPRSAKRAFNVSIAIKPGTIGTFEGLDAAARLPGVIRILKGHTEGRTLTRDNEGQLLQIAVRILGVAHDAITALKTIKSIQEVVRVYSPNGDDLTLDAPTLHNTGVFL